jgi:hypothetical protein
MLYKVPMPTRSNGVKIVKIGDHEIGIEYQTGEPHVGKMAFDSQCGILSRNITFRRPTSYYAAIVADAVRQVDAEDAMMPKAGISRSKSMVNDDNDDADAAMAKVLEFLENIISPNDLEIVQALFLGADDVDAARELQAVARRDEDRGVGLQAGDSRARRLAADRAARRPMSAATEEQYSGMFPNAGRLS